MLVFKYLLRVFKYLTIAYNNHPVKKYSLSLITVHILGLHDYRIIRRSKTHVWNLLAAYKRSWNPNECKFVNIQYL